MKLNLPSKIQGVHMFHDPVVFHPDILSANRQILSSHINKVSNNHCLQKSPGGCRVFISGPWTISRANTVTCRSNGCII